MLYGGTIMEKQDFRKLGTGLPRQEGTIHSDIIFY
jgi:hypothetical protein